MLSVAGRGIRYEHREGRRHCGNPNPCPTALNKCPCGEAVKAEIEKEEGAA
jgi:hypothetical protein